MLESIKLADFKIKCNYKVIIKIFISYKSYRYEGSCSKLARFKSMLFSI